MYRQNRQLGELEAEKRIATASQTVAPDSDLIAQVQAGNDSVNTVISSRSDAEIAALPTQQRQREYGMTYQEKLDYTQANDLNPDFSSKYNEPGIFNNNSVIGSIVTGALIGSALVVTGGLIAGASADVAAGAAVAATGSPEVAAPIAAAIASAPVAAPVVTTIAETAAVGAGVSGIGDFFGGLIQQASSIVDSVADSPLLDNPLVQNAIGKALGGTTTKLQQANAGVVSPSSSSLNAQQVGQQIDEINKKLGQLPSQQGATKTDWTPALIGGGLLLLVMLMGGKKR